MRLLSSIQLLVLMLALSGVHEVAAAAPEPGVIVDTDDEEEEDETDEADEANVVPVSVTPTPATKTPTPPTKTPAPATKTPTPATKTPTPATKTPDPALPTPSSGTAPELSAPEVEAPVSLPVGGASSPRAPKAAWAPKAKGADNRTPLWFKKGELASVGALGLLPWRQRIGTRFDIERLGPVFYMSATPTINAAFPLGERELALSLGFPLRFQLLDTRGSTTDERWGALGTFRTADWDTPQDFAKVIRFLSFGRKEEHFYASLNAFGTSTVGHGTLIRRYNPNLALDVQRVSLELDAFSDYVGAETYVNDIAHPNLVGGLVFVKPLSLLDRSNYVLRSFSVGFAVLADWDAPMVNKLDTLDVDRDGRRGEILLGGDNLQPQFHSGTVVGYGVDIETKFYKSPDRTVDLKAYVDLSFLTGQIPKPCQDWQEGPDKARCSVLFTNDPVTLVDRPDSIESQWVTSNGFTAGFLGRFTLGEERDHALRLRLELRSYEANYLPSYFDTFYQVERVQYRNSRDPAANDPANQTKIRRILERSSAGRVFGAYVEASYAFADVFEGSLGLNLNSATSDNGFYLHLGVPKSENFSFVMTYYKSTSHIDDLFDLATNSLFLLQGRATVFPGLAVTFGAVTPFGFGDSNEFEQVFDINVGLELSFAY